MNKKFSIILSVVVVLLLVGGGYFFWRMQMEKSPKFQGVKNVQEATQGVAEDVTKGVLPEIDTGVVNPLQDAQSANPYNTVNPFSY